MGANAADQLAANILLARERCYDALHERRRRAFAIREFGDLFRAVIASIEAVKGSARVHRKVAAEISGLREDLELQEFRTPGGILYPADRLECIFFSGRDPHFEGDEAPGL